jgi:hypothetical protein
MDVDIDLTNDMSSRMFALTVTDDGPNIAAQPSPLWNGRAAVQDRLPATDTRPLLSALQDIQTSTSRILAAVRTTSAKKDRRQKKEMEVLDNLENLIIACNIRLTFGLPDCVAFAKNNYNKMCDSLTTISRRMIIVQARKEDVRNKLRELKARLDTYAAPEVQNTPLQYDPCE